MGLAEDCKLNQPAQENLLPPVWRELLLAISKYWLLPFSDLALPILPVVVPGELLAGRGLEPWASKASPDASLNFQWDTKLSVSAKSHLDVGEAAGEWS